MIHNQTQILFWGTTELLFIELLIKIRMAPTFSYAEYNQWQNSHWFDILNTNLFSAFLV